MDTTDPIGVAERLASEFRVVWETSATLPDVVGFLAGHPEASVLDRLDVLRVDLRQRWKQGNPVPIKAYLRAFPEIAGRVDLVRLLVEADQKSRRELGRRPGLLAGDEFSDLSAQPPTELSLGVSGQSKTLTEESTQCATDLPRDPRRETVTENELLETRSRDATSGGLDFELATAVERLSRIEGPQPLLEHPRFTVLGQLGAGGMGVVYEAYDQERGEFVALKTMRRIDHHSLVRFKQEFRTLCDLSHPNLVNLYQLFALEHPWFFTMELVDGCDFLTYVRGRRIGGPLPQTRLSHQPTPPSRDARYEPPDSGPDGEWSFEEGRLREALSQLAEGVHSLHQAGKLHRDIKPTNVLVDGSGRVVLLDFGLTADLEVATGEHCPIDGQVVGTLAHMSPEQAVGQPVSPASDWYSVGVMLYQALTGRLPYEGSYDEVVRLKLAGPPRHPAEASAVLPADLVALCTELLRPDPADRPTGSSILARLKGSDPSGREPMFPLRPLPLIGRVWHRQVLDTALAAVRDGRASAVFVEGRTGTGKTALIRAFADDLRGDVETLVLAGRCYEREWIPYKALDSLVDGLARHLRQFGEADRARLLPADAPLLSRVFPILGGVLGGLAAKHPEPEIRDPHEFRSRVFAVLRELLTRLGEERTLVLLIDDLQWGDADSGMLLADLLYGPAPPRLLFVGCTRLEDADRSRLLPLLRQARENPSAAIEHHELAVEPLTVAESRELARTLIDLDETAALAMAHLVARESEGNPLFIEELARHVRAGGLTGDWESPAGLDLEPVLWSRIQAQPPDARRLLEVVAVSGRPIPDALAFRVAGLGAGGRIALGSLRASRLIRNLGADQVDLIEAYHDRIRTTVRDHLSPEALGRYHRRLAELLENSSDADPEALADHFLGAGEPVRACDYLVRAADRAAKALAFDQAARLYARALEQHRGPVGHAARISRGLGEALAACGRGAEAATYLLRAAREADDEEADALRRQASTQLLLGGRADEGLSLLRTNLAQLGLRMPTTPRGAWLSLGWHRARVRLRGLRFRRRDASRVPAKDLDRIDLCWAAVAGLNVIDPILAADFQTRGLLLALRAGEPFRVARALAMEAAHHAMIGGAGAQTASRLLTSAEQLADSLDSPQLGGTLAMARGVSDLMSGRWPAAQEWFDRADRQFRAHGAGVAWERDTLNTLNLLSLLLAGRIGALRERWTSLTREAKERGNLFATTTLTTFFTGMVRLADDDTRRIEEEIAAALAPWKGRGFLLQHATAFRSLLHLDLYGGKAREALDRIEAAWPEYTRSLLFRIQMIRIQLLEMRARCRVAVAEGKEDRAELLTLAEQDVTALLREDRTWAAAHAEYLRAAIAACRCDVAASVHHLTRAAEQYDAAGMSLNAAVMRYRSGEVQPGDEGRELIGRAERWIRAQSVRSPRQWAQMIAPGFSAIATCKAETSYRS